MNKSKVLLLFRYVYEGMTTDFVYILFGCFFLLVNAIMLESTPKSYEVDTVPRVYKSMENIAYGHLVIAAITLSAFMILDCCFDFVFSKINRGISPKKFWLNIFTLSTLLLSSILIFCVAIPTHNYFLILSVVQARMICISCVSLTYMHYYGGSCWRKPYLLLAVPLWGISFHIRSYLQYQQEDVNGQRFMLYLISFIMIGISSAIILIPFFQWLFKFIKEIKKQNILSDDDRKAAFYVTKFLICAVVIAAATSNQKIQNYSKNILIAQEIAFILFIALQHMYETKTIREDSYKYQRELEFKRMFVRYISHEIRTPLNTAIMGLQFLCENLPPTDVANRETVTEVRKSCDVAVGILNELLTFDKLEEGALMLEKVEVNAMTLIRESVNPFQVQASQAGVTLKLLEAFEDSTILNETNINVDPNKVAQVIRNLVSNGLKFTPQGGTVTVSVDIVQTEPYLSLKIDVVDTGAGISLENQKRLFKEVVQFNPGKLQKGGGSGLGLYISNGIVGLHGGKLSVSSVGEGFGCTFTLILPTDFAHTRHSSKYSSSSRMLGIKSPQIRQSTSSGGAVSLRQPRIYHKQQTLEATVSHNNRQFPDSPVYPSDSNFHSSTLEFKKPSSQAFILPNDNVLTMDEKSCHSDTETTSRYNEGSRMIAGLNLLVADDSALNRKMLIRLLERRCKRCIEAEDGLQVVNLISSSLADTLDSMKIDIIVMDANMPFLSGMEATKRIREMGYKGLIIGVTGNVTVEDIESFIQHGADAVLPKPLDVNAFDDLLLGFYFSSRHQIA